MKIRIYSDGACSGNPGPGGWAAIILFPESKSEISGYAPDTTNNRMELLAVIEGIRHALRHCNDGHIEVYSDSAYVVNAVKNEWIKRWAFNRWQTVKHEPVKNKDLWIRLQELIDKCHKFNIVKIKGHNGHKHNERVDLLAKQEIEENR